MLPDNIVDTYFCQISFKCPPFPVVPEVFKHLQNFQSYATINIIGE